jgi:2-polyprenyl-3-methyl-5-hydroxy-6-metoxy-1,4-benzoquinol methylase
MAANTATDYGVFPRPSHDEAARQRYAMNFRGYLFGPLREAVGKAFYASAAPAFEAREGKKPEDRRDARAAALTLSSYQAFSDLHRLSQEMIWNSVIDTLDRNEEQLSEAYSEVGDGGIGSLRLNPDLEIPRYVSAIDIHVMPGNYQADRGENDVITGALYDRGGYLYGPGGGPRGEGMGHTSVAFIKQHYPDLQPKRILDMGCAIGGPTGPLVDAFPDAEVHGIDVGAALLRYAHMRAEAMGRKIHFSQQNAEDTDFEDGSFDLIVSHIMFHETSAKAVQPILNECRRLLAPGGVMLHLDLPSPNLLPDPFTKVIFDGDAFYNNEPFWMRMHDLDWAAMMEKAGFDKEHLAVSVTPGLMLMPPTPENPEGSWQPGRLAFSAFHAQVPA